MESSADVRAYYFGALTALRHVEARRPTGRRFGAEADARWTSFRGDLTTADRIDLLIRDADAQWPGSFGARNVFARPATSEDEPFGIGWEPMDPIDAEDLWRESAARPAISNVAETLHAVAAHWKLSVSGVAEAEIQPAEKVVVAGPAALIAVIDAFSRGQDLDWGDQVLVVATPPAHRQIAALGTALLNAKKPAPIFAGTDSPSTAARRLIVSDDADASDARLAHACGGAG